MFENEFTSDLREIVEENVTPFRWKNAGGVEQVYGGIFSPSTELNSLAPGGFRPEIDASMYCALIDLEAGKPAIGDRLRILGKYYRIVSVELDDLRVGINFLLETIEK